jgi:hypothetical protein
VAVIQASHFSTEGGYAMSDDNVVQLIQPGSFSDSLTEVLRNGARSMLAKAVEAEVASFLARRADLKTTAAIVSCVTGICPSGRS